ncbi:MAG: hypothetical protein ACQERU_08905 [Bacteroidota bacterium]
MDKYRIITALISLVLCDKIWFQSIIDAGIKFEISEEGSIIQRAEQKAIEVWKYMNRTERKKYFATIGIDDGFSLKKDDEGDPNSKLVTDKILSGTFIKKNRTIWLKRGIALYNEQGLNSILTTIPFVFLGNPNNIKHQEGAYSLMQVLRPINGNSALNEIEFDEAIQYYSSYCNNDIKRLFNEMKNY